MHVVQGASIAAVRKLRTTASAYTLRQMRCAAARRANTALPPPGASLVVARRLRSTWSSRPHPPSTFVSYPFGYVQIRLSG
eukprot:5759137-Pleurochrysis_carterae.AAC.1